MALRAKAAALDAAALAFRAPTLAAAGFRPQRRAHARCWAPPPSLSVSSSFSASSRAPPPERQLRWCGSTSEAPKGKAKGRRVAISEGDPFSERLKEALLSSGAAAAAKQAFADLGAYHGNEVAWQHVTELLCATMPGASEPMPHPRKMHMEELLQLVRILAEQAELTQASFWEKLTAATKFTFQASFVSMEDSIELTGLYTRIGAWRKEVFQATLSKVAKEGAVHWMEPNQLAELLAIFSRAGSASSDLSGLTTRLFNELEERILEDGHTFEIDDCVSIVESMARFATRDNEVILRHLGRERLHPRLLELPGPRIASVCYSYGALGWRHDTVFKEVMTAIIQEQEKLQRARVLGLSAGAQEPLKFRASEVALVAMAMVRLRMYRGNNEWYRWGENYEELLDILEKRLETPGELQQMNARSLACAAFALGRARRGSEELCAALLGRMTQLLESGQVSVGGSASENWFREAPQEELERFMHGLAMMGPTKRKEFLDTQWLREWMCVNYYTLSLPDLIRVNRYLVQIRSFDQPYLETFVPLYCEPENMSQLKKSDIMELTHTYNGAKLKAEDMDEGQHFFWALGKQYQSKHIAGLSESLSVAKRRPAVERQG